jgi:hypothetical protein
MYKYISVNKIVMKVTDDEALRTFFTLYLMEEDEAKRDQIDEQFWQDLDVLPDEKKALLREKLKASFRKLPEAVAEWGQDVDNFIAAYLPKAA